MEHPEVDPPKETDGVMFGFYVLAIVAVFLVVLAVVANMIGQDSATLPEVIPACTTEDSVDVCWWDASIAGNGTGTSFLVDTEGQVHYLMERP